jgi:hypothetical protein
MFRHTICKHTVAVALQAVRTPVSLDRSETITHLMRQNAGTVVCGEKHPQKLLVWPWPESIVTNQTQWPEITICPDCIRDRYPLVHSAMREAA